MPDQESEKLETTETPAADKTSETSDDFDKERAMRTITALREEVKTLKPTAKKLAELEKLEAERKTAEMSELERANERATVAEAKAAQAEARAQETLVRAAFVSQAAKVGALFPDDVYLLADRSAVSVSEDGSVMGVKEAVKALVDSKRIPLGGRSAPDLDGDAGGNDRQKSAAQRLTPDDLEIARKMGIAPEKFAAQKAAIAAAGQQKEVNT
jgi:hypothetical protein